MAWMYIYGARIFMAGRSPCGHNGPLYIRYSLDLFENTRKAFTHAGKVSISFIFNVGTHEVHSSHRDLTPILQYSHWTFILHLNVAQWCIITNMVYIYVLPPSFLRPAGGAVVHHATAGATTDGRGVHLLLPHRRLGVRRSDV